MATKLYQNPKEDLKLKDGPTLVAQAQMNPQEEQQEQEEDQNAMQVLQPPGGSPEKAAMEIGQIGPVQVEMLEGLDVLIIRGHKKDVEQVMNVIKQVEQLSTKTEPAIEIYKLKYIDCQALADMITQVYGRVYEIRQGMVGITALVKPNALLILGRKENVKTVLDLVRKLDQPTAPETQFHVFRLQHTSSATALDIVNDFYNAQLRNGLGTRVLVSGDNRLNSLIVQASPRDMAEVAELIARIDKPASEAVNELRVIPLRYSMANDLATILMNAISGQAQSPDPRRIRRSRSSRGRGGHSRTTLRRAAFPHHRYQGAQAAAVGHIKRREHLARRRGQLAYRIRSGRKHGPDGSLDP